MAVQLTSRREARTRTVSFWTVALVLGSLLAGASAPSPLYASYAAAWGFSAISITIVFGVYAISLLVTLLTTGALSDAVGRRPVILAALGLQILAMVAFLVADGLGWLYLARILQGLGTGLGTPAVAAALIDLTPPERPGRAALVNAVTPMFGLAFGAIVSAVLVEYAPAPFRLTYALLTVVFVVLAAGVLAMREPLPTPVDERPSVSLRPRVSVRREVRGAFLAVVPCLVATWALGGLYLSLGPSIVASLEVSGNRLLGGLLVCSLTIPAGLACLLTHDWPPVRILVVGCSVLAAGLLVTIVAIATASGTVLFAGTVLSGIGFGTGFLGAFRTLLSLAGPDARAGLVAAVYLVSYLCFGVPAVIAGLLVGSVGLHQDAIGYAGIAAALALIAVLAQARRMTLQRS